MKKNFTLFPLCVLLLFSLSASAQSNFALNFDGGATHYVATPFDIVPTGSADFTVEFWAYVPSYATGQHVFVSQGDFSGGKSLSIGYNGDLPGAGVGNITVGTLWPDTGIPMPIGQWVHIAVAYVGGTQTATLFLNGVQKASSNFQIQGGASPLQIGAQTDQTSLMTGEIDELRIWDIPLTAAQLKQNLFGVDAASADLIAYYKMDENTGTSITSSSTGPQAYPGNAQGTWQAGAAWTASPIQPGTNAVNFNAATNTRVSVPANPAYDWAQGTIELWVNPGALSHPGDMISIRGAAGSRFTFQLDPTTPGYVELWNDFNLSSDQFSYTVGTWYHLAFVCTPTETDLYINGVLRLPVMSPIHFALTGLPLSIGISDNQGSFSEPFTGSIDEVSIWNIPRTVSDINADMANGPTGGETGLVGLFNFNYGIPNGNNSNLVTAIDYSPLSNNGTLNGLALSGTSSNFVTGVITTLPVNFTGFTATAQEGQALLQWQTAQEQNSRDYTIERSPDAVHYNAIGSVPAAGNSTLPSSYSFIDPAPLNGTNYYRLKESDLDGKFMYSLIRSLNFSGDAQKLVWFQTGDKAVEVDLRPGSNELYSVADISGRLVQQGQLSSGKLYLSQLPAGLYVVKVTTTTGTVLTTRVLVQ